VYTHQSTITHSHTLCSATKFQDLRVVKGIGDGPATPFEHPFFQTACMFLGELLCLFVYRLTIMGAKSAVVVEKKETERSGLIQNDQLAENTHSETNVTTITTEEKKKPELNPLILWIPACCDLGGTTLLNVGLFLTYASVYQMLRGIVVVFNGLLALIFLKQRLYYHHWAGIILIVIGTGVVGATSIIYPAGEGAAVPRNPFLGNLLVIAAQVLAAIQFVVEEKFLSKYDAKPLQVVGWEGFWGLSMCSIVLFVLYWIPGSDYHSMENAVYASAQCFNDVRLLGAVLGSVLSIAFFNYFGISITQRISSTTRSTIDSMRTFIIWIVSLIIGWETFHYLQVIGFLILVCGSFLYNEVVKIPYYSAWYHKSNDAYKERLENQRIDNERSAHDKKIQKRKILQQKMLDGQKNYGTY
jgi:drug/metabolite transporter (DMT)-like permease